MNWSIDNTFELQDCFGNKAHNVPFTILQILKIQKSLSELLVVLLSTT